MAGIARPLFNLIFGTAADMVVVVSAREGILLEIVSTLCELGSLCTRANARNEGMRSIDITQHLDGPVWRSGRIDRGHNYLILSYPSSETGDSREGS